MRKLFLFLARYSIVILFLILEIVSFMLYVNNEKFAKSVFFSSSNNIISGIYSVSNSVTEFFKLRSTNENLSVENALLKEHILSLENEIASYVSDSVVSLSYTLSPEKEFEYISAKVINNSTNRYKNYITLNKGALDGVRPDMGVVSPEGVVGIVKTVSDHFSSVISLLNPLININSRIERIKYVGPLVWDGADYRYARLTDIPRHVVLQVGDTIVTSGLTSIFPEGIPVGTIEEFSINDGDAYYDIKVRLAVNFRVLSQVHILDYKNYDEQQALEAGN